MANEKSKAEQYRDERKARIAEAAKKNAKDMQKKNATKKAVKKIVAIVLAAVIALGAVGLTLNYYGVWERAIPSGYVGDDYKFSMAEYEYHYWAAYNQLVSNASQSYSTGEYYGYDTSVSPADQTTTAEDDKGNPISWVEFIRKEAINNLKLYNVYYAEAEKLGLAELTDAEQKQIDDTVENMRKTASGENSTSATAASTPKYSLNAYLRMNFGSYMNESYLREIMKKEIVVQKFVEQKLEKVAEAYSDADIKAEYNKNKSDYDMVDFRLYEFTKTELKAETGESNDALKDRQAEADKKVEQDAKAFYEAITDEASFVAKVTELNKDTKDYDVDSNTKAAGMLKSEAAGIHKDLGEWLFKADTKVGAKKMFTSADGKSYFIVLVTAEPHQVQTVSVRHILFATTDMTTGAALSADEIAQKEKDAKAALDKWSQGDKSEDLFAELATELTEDTGSQSTGGLYEAVRPGRMVAEFDEWIFDSSRKAGDTGIVKTDYGYHVMYFVGNDGEYYDSTIRMSMAEKDVESELKELVESDTYKVSFGVRRVEFAENKINKLISKLLAQSANQSSYSY